MSRATGRGLMLSLVGLYVLGAATLASFLLIRRTPEGGEAKSALGGVYGRQRLSAAEVSEREAGARFRYCLEIGGLVADESPDRLACYLGPRGTFEVICDDVPDARQCGILRP